ncbi:MAG: hypothetical protein JO030_06965 [Candidatus Eremiobacteraeota bacterium]|nr:hypothetical protein [Candidatus Eremiobacteraeota bacterium]
MGKVDGITLDAPSPPALAAGFDRFVLGRLALGWAASTELFGVDFGAVVFAITLFLCGPIVDSVSAPRTFGHTKKTKHWLP